MDDPIEVYRPGDTSDPRTSTDDPPGAVVRRGPPLHPDDMTVVDGIPVTSLPRTLIDLAEVLEEAELRECFERARAQGLVELEALRASRARMEWRPSLTLVDRMIEELATP